MIYKSKPTSKYINILYVWFLSYPCIAIKGLHEVSQSTISMQLHFDYATEYKKYAFSNAFRVQKFRNAFRILYHAKLHKDMEEKHEDS